MRQEQGMDLRFIERDGKKILQKAVRFTEFDSRGIAVNGGHDWQDVPLEKDWEKKNG